MTVLVPANVLAAKLGVSYSTILAWRRRGWIVGRRAIGPGGGRLVFDLDEVRHALRDGGERVLMPKKVVGNEK